ncbi:MAG: cupin domain-containing protein [Acidimicrobiales bacterium]
MDPVARELIERLGLEAHPEGGWYIETWRAPASPGERPASTVISFLLCSGERSHWHRVDADEIWCHQAGATLTLSVAEGGGPIAHHRLDAGVGRPDGATAQAVPHAVVPAGAWQAAETTGAWSLVTCVVAPGFDFAGFELAPPGWEPGAHR